MKAVVFHGPEDMRVEQVPDPGLQKPTDALIQVERTAICGSDLHLWHRPAEVAADDSAERGFVVGHEFLGRVVDVGAQVRNVRKGDRVLVACTTGCGECASCRSGVYGGCPVTTAGFTQQNIFGFSNGLWGGQSEAVRVPFADANCVRIPGGLEDEQVLFLTDILPTGYLGADLAEVAPGDTVVVFGCGPVGTFAQQCAQLRGAAEVIAVDLDGGRLERARQRGCVPFDPASGDLAQFVFERTEGLGAHCSIEAVGKPELVNQAALVTRPGGRVAVIGVVLGPFEIQWPLLLGKNLTLRTGLVSPQVYIPALLPLIREERIDPTQIISHRYDLDDAVQGYEVFANHREDVLKVVLTP